ncbi:MAG: nitroreductase family protein [Lachnospiraceae bacterium]|nr:nitroreductase family protein [Lachnospiraceae bacterium]
MELQTAIENRRSIRCYDASKKVTEEELRTLIAAALQAPSWKNSQTGRYSVVYSEEKKAQVLEKCLPPFNAKNAAGAAALIVTSYVKNWSGYDRENGTPANEVGNGWGMYDLGLQNENLLLKAKEMGMDTLVMGIRDAAALRELLDIDETQEIASVIALGYAAQEPRPRVRKTVDEIARFF